MLALVGLYAVACGPAQARSAERNEPARLESIDGSDRKRVILTARAAERIGLQATPVREEPTRRTRTVGGEVVAIQVALPDTARAPVTGSGRMVVRVRLSPSELDRVDRGEPALVLPRAGPHPAAKGVTASAVASPAGADAAALHYLVDDADHGLAPGQRVLVTLRQVGGEVLRTLVPYSAVLYDLSGGTWVYVQERPLTYVRRRIIVEYVEADVAVLSDGPPAGTEVVTTGATELFGTESKIGQ